MQVAWEGLPFPNLLLLGFGPLYQHTEPVHTRLSASTTSHLNQSHLRAAAAAAKSLQSCLTLCDPIDGSPLGSAVPGILQARTLEWVAIAFSNAWRWKVKVKSQSCPTLRDLMDCSPPGSSVHGIFQARVLEWAAIAFSDLRARLLQSRRRKEKEARKFVSVASTWYSMGATALSSCKFFYYFF